MEKHARACEDRRLVEGIEAFLDAIDQLADPYFHSLSSAGAEHLLARMRTIDQLAVEVARQIRNSKCHQTFKCGPLRSV